jgi:predicted dehydrogenase
MRFLLGDYAEVDGTLETFIKERPLASDPAKLAPVEVDDYSLLRVRMASGAVGIVEASRFATGTNDGLTFEIYGEHGALKFDMMEPSFLQVYDGHTPDAPIGGLRGFTKVETVQKYPKPSALPSPKLPIGWERFHVACLYNFLRTIAEDADCSPSLLDGANCQAVMEAAQVSAEGGRAVGVEAV